MTGGWVSVHAYQHTGQDRLVAEAAVPELRRLEASGACTDWFFLRYWDGGPHVRFRAAAAPGAAPAVRDDLVAALRAHVRAHPAPSTMDPDRYRAAAAALAQYEGLAGYERELRPPGSVAEVAYRPETHVYGTGAALEAVERHFGMSSRLAAEVLAEGTPPGRRRGLLLSLTVLTVAVVEPDLGRVATAMERLRPHAGPDAAPPDAAGLARIVGQVEGLWALATGSETGSEVLHRWRDAMRALRTDLQACRGSGEFAVAPSRSPLGWCLPGVSAADAVLARCTHLFGNRIGVTVDEEMRINVLMARAVAAAGTRPASARS